MVLYTFIFFSNHFKSQRICRVIDVHNQIKVNKKQEYAENTQRRFGQFSKLQQSGIFKDSYSQKPKPLDKKAMRTILESVGHVDLIRVSWEPLKKILPKMQHKEQIRVVKAALSCRVDDLKLKFELAQYIAENKELQTPEIMKLLVSRFAYLFYNCTNTSEFSKRAYRFLDIQETLEQFDLDFQKRVVCHLFNNYANGGYFRTVKLMFTGANLISTSKKFQTKEILEHAKGSFVNYLVKHMRAFPDQRQIRTIELLRCQHDVLEKMNSLLDKYGIGCNNHTDPQCKNIIRCVLWIMRDLPSIRDKIKSETLSDDNYEKYAHLDALQA